VRQIELLSESGLVLVDTLSLKMPELTKFERQSR